MGSLKKRTGALEDYIEGQVQERMRLEVEAMVDVLEEKLTREEFVKVARIVIEVGEQAHET
jgi:hypothetical protein